jgi:hypothetical protein
MPEDGRSQKTRVIHHRQYPLEYFIHVLFFIYIHSFYTVLLRCRGFHFSLDLYTIGRTPWMSERPVTSPLLKYSSTKTQKKGKQTLNIYALIGIRTYDHNVLSSEDSSCLTPLGYRERPL